MAGPKEVDKVHWTEPNWVPVAAVLAEVLIIVIFMTGMLLPKTM